jgi:hypothetical protein
MKSGSVAVISTITALTLVMQNCAPADSGSGGGSGQIRFLYDVSNASVYFQSKNRVMYYLNEGAADMRHFVVRFVTSGDRVMWGPEVLQDVQGFSR